MRRIVMFALVFVVLAASGSIVWAQGELTLEGVAEALAALTKRVDSLEEIEERMAAVETRTAPTPTPRPTPTARPTATATATPVPTTVLVVTVARGNVRSGPGTQHDILGVVTQGDTLTGPYQETAGWYQFCCVAEDEIAWISKTLVAVKEKAELTAWEKARNDAIEVEPETLLRYNADYVDELVYYSNVYVFQGGDNFVLVYLDPSYEHIGYLIYENSSPRVLEEDKIDFVARVDSIYTYESTTNNMVTSILLEVVELRLSD